MKLFPDQEEIAKAYGAFLLEEGGGTMRISGGPGYGKSAMVEHLIEMTPKILGMRSMITGSDEKAQILLTASTNKAAANLGNLCGTLGVKAKTIHSTLKLRMKRDYSTGQEYLVETESSQPMSGKIIFIDEAGSIGASLLEKITRLLSRSKVIFIGDADQTLPIKESVSPVFAKGEPVHYLSTPKRQEEGNSILQLASLLRETVRGGSFPSDLAIGDNVHFLEPKAFAAKLDELIGYDGYQGENRILVWRNNTAKEFNDYCRGLHYPDAAPVPGEQYVVRKPVVIENNILHSIEEVLTVDSMRGIETLYEVEYYPVRTTSYTNVRIPVKPDELDELMNYFRKEKNWKEFYKYQDAFADVRPVYAGTIHSAQGSTYDNVFIDLTDIGGCRNPKEVARILYVAITRARHNVYVVGSLPAKYRR